MPLYPVSLYGKGGDRDKLNVFILWCRPMTIRIELDNGLDWYFPDPTAKMIMIDGRDIPVSEVVVGDRTWFGDYNNMGSHGAVAVIEDVSA